MNQRARLRAEANVIRQIGEPVTLLVGSGEGVPLPRATATDIIAEQSAKSPTTNREVPIYAKVVYKDFASVSFDQGGRVKLRNVEIEAQAAYLEDLVACFGFQLQDGTTYRKVKERLSEGQDSFFIEGAPERNQVF